MDYLKYVNIKQGTFSVRRFSNGNTLPLVQLPFAMAGYSAQTEYDGGWFYHPTHRSLEGIRLTHQPSPWISDYGTFLFTPQTGEIRDSVGSAWSSYRPEDAVMTPTYMKLRFLRSRTDFELTPGERSCKIRLTYPEDRTPYFTVFPVFGNYTFDFDFENNRLLCTTDGARGAFHEGFKTYLVVQFKSKLDPEKSYKKDGEFIHAALYDTSVEADIASSYISFEQALENMKQECTDKSFDELHSKGNDIWNEYLSRIEIDPVDEKQMKTFYSCM